MTNIAPTDHGLQYRHKIDDQGERYLVLVVDGYELAPHERRRVMQHANASIMAMGWGYWRAVRNGFMALYPEKAESLD